MLLRHARLATIWCEVLGRMEPFDPKIRNGHREAAMTLLALSGEGLALNGTVNICEPLKSVVTDNKLKVLISLHQNGNVIRLELLTLAPTQTNNHRHTEGT
jgi:hypothetical protein